MRLPDRVNVRWSWDMKKFVIMISIWCMVTVLLGCSERTEQKEEASVPGEEKQNNVELLTSILECEEKKTEVILDMLEELQINDLTEAELLSTEDGYQVRITEKNGKEYEICADKKYHLYAVKDLEDGQYIYAEYE